MCSWILTPLIRLTFIGEHKHACRTKLCANYAWGTVEGETRASTAHNGGISSGVFMHLCHIPLSYTCVTLLYCTPVSHTCVTHLCHNPVLHIWVTHLCPTYVSHACVCNRLCLQPVSALCRGVCLHPTCAIHWYVNMCHNFR